MFKHVLVLSLGFFLISCSNDECRETPNIENSEIEIELIRHEERLINTKSEAEMLQFLIDNPVLTKEFLGGDQYPNDTILAKTLLSRFSNPAFIEFNNEVNQVFGNLSDFKSELERTYSLLKFYYPETKIPRIETMVTGFGSSEMFVSDSLIIIGLDFYLGPDATYRPDGYPEYIMRRFQKEYIIPAIVLLETDKYSRVDPGNQTMLADMIFYGKKYFLAEYLLPCTPDSLIIWYTEDELTDVNENQHIIWASFLENEVLYDSDHEVKERFLGERPNTYEISAACPGRIGAWVGWEIVRKYAERNPDISLQEIMANPDAQEIFNDSNYKGQNPGIF